MFQEMINGSIAVLSRPSVATFEEHEKDNLTWALIYAVIAAVINAIIYGLTAPLRVQQSRAAIESQLEQARQQGLDTSFLEQAFAQAAQPNIVGDALGALVSTIIGSLIVWGLIYLIGRAFGGTGNFGELAWDISLFSSPLSVISVVVGLVPFVGGIIGFLVSIYGLYLGFLSLQSGLNLDSRRALYVVLIIGLIWLVFFCFIFSAAVLAGLGLAALSGQ